MDTIAHGYPGGPLDDEDSFRVIEIQPGERDDPIIVRLVTTNLRDCSSYEALSYAWGDLTETESIQVVAATRPGHDDSPKAPLPVTIGCADSLRRLRSGTATRTLWVDSICINQTLVPERNQQLRLMSHIYSGAARVVIYLGESSGADSSEVVMDWLRELHEPSDAAAGHLPAPDLTVLRAFLGRRWFTRVWVLQEIRLAREAIVVCGDREVTWDAFRELRDWWRNCGMSRESNGSWDLPYTVGSLISDATDWIPWFLPSYPVRLLRLLVGTQFLGATDARDKLFAVLPLLTWESRRHRETHAAFDGNDDGDDDDPTSFVAPECDYRRRPADLFTQLARDLINAVGLQVLYYAATPTALPGLPSWVPDWGVETTHTWRNRRERGRSLMSLFLNSNINKETPRTWNFSDYTTALSGEQQRTQLHISAAVGDAISKIGDVCDVYADNFPLEQWEGLCDPVHLGEDGPGSCPGNGSRFVQVLFKDEVRIKDVAIKAAEAIKEYNLEKSGHRPPQSTAVLLGSFIHFDARDTGLADIFKSMALSYERQMELIFQCCHLRRLFVTEAGHLGLAPEAARVGDRVMAIQDLDVPFIVRSGGSDDDGLEAVRLLGTCYREKLSLMAEGGKDANHPINYEERVIR